jgi:hypothetical protein
VALLAFGPLLYEALKVAETLNATVVNMRWAKPLDVDMLKQITQSHDRLVTLEDATRKGGAGSAVMEALQDMGIAMAVLAIGFEDEFTEHGDPQKLMQQYGLTAPGIQKRIEEYWESLLQPYTKKIPSRLLVSIPSGEVVFVKSEKDSRPKELKTKSSPFHGLLFNDLREQSFQGKGSKLLFRSKNQMLWILELMNMKFFAKKILQSSPELVEFFWAHRFRFLWEALSEPSAEQIGQCPEDGGTSCPDPMDLRSTVALRAVRSGVRSS